MPDPIPDIVMPISMKLFLHHWIFDISPSANGKSRYKVRHEATDAA
ncbi:MAG: hypothetical protein U9N82_11885 [Thermodesulfobacteriota bacterium]|nr:hypothetical protein [Thermodesulfobacteriota bacterium]